MAELTDYLDNWIGRARWLLDPWQRIDITARTKAVCPYCGSKLTCWLYTQRKGASYITCDPGHIDSLGPSHWPEADWPRLGVMTGVHIDARYGPHLQVVEDPT